MFLLFLVLWIIFNGRVTVEIILFGLVISVIMYGFICKFMDFSPKTEIKYLKKAHILFLFFYHLIKEIVKANIATIRLIISSRREIEPALIQFDTNLQTEGAKFMLANAITMTPGTITVAIEGSCFYVHCLDKSFAEGIEESVFVKLLERLER